MSRHKMTKNEAVVILGKYFACQKRIRNCYKDCNKCKYNYRGYELNRAVKIAFKELVKTDAVEVVRCKDCKHWNRMKGYFGNYFACDMFTYNDNENGFCHLGERKEE